MAETGDNSITLQSYEEYSQKYIDATPDETSGHVKHWIDAALERTDRTQPILELGSATGRDASYIESCGFNITRSDATKSFIKRLQSHGHAASRLNALTDELKGPYGLVIANAVFLHFTPKELAGVLQKAHDALTDNGVLAFTVKKGRGSEWTNSKLDAPRFFQYWQKDALAREVEAAGFTVISLDQIKSTLHPQTIWLHLIAVKPSKKSQFAVIFDVDGVLIDSQPAVAAALKKALSHHGVRLEDLKGYHPAHSSQIVIDLVRQQYGTQIEPGDFIRRLVEDIINQLKNVKIDPQLKSLITDLKQQNVPIAVGSSATHASVMRKLAILGLSKAFNVVIGAEDVASHKPAPDVYLEAASRLGYNANQCIVVEDNHIGVTAAHSAGAYVVSFGKYNDYPQATFGADFHVSDWSELSVGLFEKLLNRQLGSDK